MTTPGKLPAISEPSVKFLLRGTLFLAILVVLIIALMPSPPAVLNLGDTAKHAAGMALLTLILAFSYPQVALTRVFAIIAGASLALEIVQGAMPFGRALQMSDWMAGLAGTLLMVSVVSLARNIRALIRLPS